MCSSKLSLGWRTTRSAVRPRNATAGTSAPRTASLPPDRPGAEASGPLAGRSCRPGSAIVRPEPAERLQPRVDFLVGMVVDALVEGQPTDDAQARAIGSV